MHHLALYIALLLLAVAIFFFRAVPIIPPVSVILKRSLANRIVRPFGAGCGVPFPEHRPCLLWYTGGQVKPVSVLRHSGQQVVASVHQYSDDDETWAIPHAHRQSRILGGVVYIMNYFLQ